MNIKKTTIITNKIILFLLIIAAIFLINNNIFAFTGSNDKIIDALHLEVDLINYNPDPIRAGDFVELKFSIINKGSVDATNVIATLDYKYPFTEIPDTTNIRNISKIFPFQNKDNAQILTYKLLVDKDAPFGTYDISLNIKREGFEISSIYNFKVNITNKEYAQIITINKANIDFGTIEKLDFLITNTGNSPIRNIVFSWNEDSDTILPVNSDNTKYIKYLDVDESITVSYNVMANTNSLPGLYKINLILDFENEAYENTQIKTTAGIFVGGETDFDITLSQNDSGHISLSIANVGNTPAYSVNVIIPEQSGFSVSGQNSNILGNLDKGDYTIASFTVTSSRTIRNMGLSETNTNSPVQNIPLNNQIIDNNIDPNIRNIEQDRETNKLKVIIEYTDSMGNRNSVEKQINFASNQTNTTTINNIENFNFGDRNRTQNKSTNTTTYIFGAIIIIIVLSIIIYKYKTKVRKI